MNVLGISFIEIIGCIFQIIPIKLYGISQIRKCHGHITMKEERRSHYRHIISDDSEESEHRFLLEHGRLVVAEQIAKDLLPYAVVNNHNYTFHDIEHSFRVCDNINIILDKFPQGTFSSLEIELLYQAALLHDIGMVFLSRDKEPRLGISHSQMSGSILRTISSRDYMNNGFSNLGSKEHVDALAIIVESHGMGFQEFDSIPDSSQVDSEVVSLKKLSAILSMAYGLELGSQRISVTAFDILTDRDLMASIADQVGTQSIPFLGKVSREHWLREKDTHVYFVDDHNIVISVCSEDAKEDLSRQVEYLEHYVSTLGLDLTINLVVDP